VLAIKKAASPEEASYSFSRYYEVNEFKDDPNNAWFTNKVKPMAKSLHEHISGKPWNIKDASNLSADEVIPKHDFVQNKGMGLYNAGYGETLFKGEAKESFYKNVVDDMSNITLPKEEPASGSGQLRPEQKSEPDVNNLSYNEFKALIDKNRKTDVDLSMAAGIYNAGITVNNLLQKPTPPQPEVNIPATTVNLERPNIFTSALRGISRNVNTGMQYLKEVGKSNEVLPLVAGANKQIEEAAVTQHNLDSEISNKEAMINAELDSQRKSLMTQTNAEIAARNIQTKREESLTKGMAITEGMKGIFSLASGFASRDAQRSESLLGYSTFVDQYGAYKQAWDSMSDLQREALMKKYHLNKS